jgi:hypothetical protein
MSFEFKDGRDFYKDGLFHFSLDIPEHTQPYFYQLFEFVNELEDEGGLEQVKEVAWREGYEVGVEDGSEDSFLEGKRIAKEDIIEWLDSYE